MNEPDNFTRGVRFGCGAVFGFVLPFGGGTILSFQTGRGVLGFCLLTALVCGLLAMRFGDVFWEKLVNSRFWRWWV